MEGLPSTSTINNVFRHNGLITKEASLAAKTYIRFEKDEPNEVWQVNFEGLFFSGERGTVLSVIGGG